MKKRGVIALTLLLGVASLGIVCSENTYAETFDGEYSIEYLLRNYNIVTLGIKNHDAIPYKVIYRSDYTNNDPVSRDSNYNYRTIQINKGDFQNFTSVDGAVLINGDYKSVNPSTFGAKAGSVKSFIKGTKGDNITASSSLVTDSNFIDFDRLYKNVVNESQQLLEKAQHHINSAKLEVSEPGIYTIHNTAVDSSNNGGAERGNSLLIKNYDPNALYVFNYNNEYIYHNLPNVYILKSGDNNAVPIIDSLQEYNETGYTGNVLFNLPNAKFIYLQKYQNNQNIGYYSSAHNIIAPNAKIYFNHSYKNNSSDNSIHYDTFHMGNIIAGTVYAGNCNNNGTTGYNNRHIYYGNYLYSSNYSSSQKILENDSNFYYQEPQDYTDDMYSRDYSIKDILENYSLVTLGHKPISSKSKINELGNNPGSVKLFHITGQALIAGDVYTKEYPPYTSEGSTSTTTTTPGDFDRLAFDLESNKVAESYIRGNIKVDMQSKTVYKSSGSTYTNTDSGTMTVIQPWDNMANDNMYYSGKNNSLLVNINNRGGTIGEGNITAYTPENSTYINFDRLYNNIVAEQSGIARGTTLTPNADGVLHVPTGGCYTIANISSVKEIVFDNFAKNKDEVTIITIEDEGDINFPRLSKDVRDQYNYDGIITNDYYNKEQATHYYELSTFLHEDSYYGNIVWNVPNADYIKLKENAPFAGHLIAPNADVETPELHFAGAFIVNSIYGEGNTEAHFYPITAAEACDCDEYNRMSSAQKQRYNAFRLSRMLGSESSIVATAVVGNEATYQQEKALFERTEAKCNVQAGPTQGGGISQAKPINGKNSNNPNTADNVTIALIVLFTATIAGTYVYKKNKAGR